MSKMFFLDGKLHKQLSLIRQQGVIVAWSYPDEKRLWYDASTCKKHRQAAYKIGEVAKLLQKDSVLIRDLVGKNILDRPSGQSYNIATRKPGVFYWSEEDVLDARNKLYDFAPKDKFNQPSPHFRLISEAELKAKLRQDSSMYIRDSNGNFVKVWRNV